MGRHEDVVEDCSQAILYDFSYLKVYMRRAVALEALEKEEEALKGTYETLNPLFYSCVCVCVCVRVFFLMTRHVTFWYAILLQLQM
jgi:hypothetical protein